MNFGRCMNVVLVFTKDIQDTCTQGILNDIRRLDAYLGVRVRVMIRIAISNLSMSGMDCVIPVPVDSMVSERVLVMTWVEGIKINDVEALRTCQVDTEALLHRPNPTLTLT